MREVVLSGEAQVALDTTTQLQATLRGADGEPVGGRQIFWSTSDPTVATVDQSGLVTPVAIGRVQVAASADGRSGVLELQVVRKRVRTIDVVVAATDLAVDDTIAARVEARARDGGEVPDVTPALSSTAPEIASVTADGRIVGRAVGTARIVASADGVADTATVTVVPARVATVVVEPASFELNVGQSLPLRVTVRGRSGTALPDRPVSYSSSAPGVATVGADGVVRAAGAGGATITASSGGVSATSRVIVVAPPPPPPPPPEPVRIPATLTIAPNVVSLQVGATRALATTLRDTEGDVMSGRPVTWRSNAPTVATVGATGVVTAVAPGAAVIVAESEGISASAGVTVANVPVARVDVSPDDVALEVGGTGQLTATPRSATGTPLADRIVTWTSSATSVATVSSTGEVRAVGAGTATISATSEGRQGTARITVTAVPGPPPPPPPPAEPEPPGPPTRIETVSGDDQHGRRGRELPNPVVMRIVDANGRPVPGVSVLWLTMHGGTFQPAVSTSDANGRVSTRWRLGNRNGRQWAQAVVLGLQPVTFGAVARNP